MLDPAEFAKILESFVAAGNMTEAEADAAQDAHDEDYLDELQFGADLEVVDEEFTDIIHYVP
jgi:hypothetical protein